jgi:hypothetical protein
MNYSGFQDILCPMKVNSFSDKAFLPRRYKDTEKKIKKYFAIIIVNDKFYFLSTFSDLHVKIPFEFYLLEIVILQAIVFQRHYFSKKIRELIPVSMKFYIAATQKNITGP